MLPTISVVIPTLNSSRILKECLASVRMQDYDRDTIEIIIVDGGSTDSTKVIVTEYGATIIEEPQLKENQEARKAIGLSRAKNELVLFIDSDNILPHKDWLKAMVKPIVADKDIVATQPLRYQYNREFSLLNRYFALFGVNDPLAYYFNKRDRLSWAEDDWRMLGEADDRGSYYAVRFSKDKLPTLGANGFLVRREIMLKAKVNPREFFHIDVNYDLVSLGYDKYGIIKDSIIHLTGDNVLTVIKKRLRYMKRYHCQDYSLRRYKLYEPKDIYKLLIFIISSVTFIRPLYDSVKGFIKIPDVAWFMHPLMCFAFVIIYGIAIIERFLSI